MLGTLKRVNIFIASPGDVSEARDRVREAIECVNRLVAKPSGFLLEAIGWEDIPSGKANRVQEVINPYVDTADIFVGILNKRFGKPTGVAESGTEEEYKRIEKRWHEEDPKPRIMIYFKKLSEEDLSDQGEQLKRVLDFKIRISDTVLYKEFETGDDLGKQIEDALADWVYKQKGSAGPALRDVNLDTLESRDLEILTCLVQNPDATIEDLQTILNHPRIKIDSSTARLERHGLVTRHHGKIRPSNSTEGFLSIVKHLIKGDHWRLLLKSEYYSHMLKITIRDLISARYHYTIGDEMDDFFRKFALLSPTAASYIFFGDTTLYDNLAEQARTLGGQQIARASEMMKQNILHQVLLRYAEDSINAKLIDTLEGRPIAGQLIAVRVAGAYEDGRAFDVLSVVPLMRFRASTDLVAGQMVTGTPETFVRTGSIFMHMGEFDLAAREFDKVLTPETPPDVRAAAMNNKGLIFLNRGQVSEAIDLFRQSIELAPSLSEPRKNLESAELMLSNKK